MNNLYNKNKLRAFMSLVLLGLLTFIIGESTKDRHINFALLVLAIGVFGGVIYLSKDFLKNVREKYGDYALRTSKEFIQKINSLFVGIYGFYLIFTVIAFDYFEDFANYSKPVLTMTLIMISADLVLGFIFLILSRLSFDKQKKSLKLLIATGVVAFVFLIANGENFMSVFPILIIMLLAYYTRDVLNKDRFIYSWEKMSIDFILFFALGFFYIININKRKNYSTYILTYRWIYLILAILVLTLFAKLIFAYMKKGKGIEEYTNLGELEKMIDKYGSKQSLASGLAFLDDKYIYFYKNKDGEETVAFQYGVINNKAIVMGEPFGKEEDIGDALFDFNNSCIRSGLSPIFYEVGEKFTLSLHDYGYDFMKFGENALVDLETFSLAGRKKSTERNILNRFKKDGYTFEIMKPPYLDDFMDKLEEISDSWLDGRDEKGFSLGFFDRYYLSKSDIAVVFDSNGDITAFTNIMPDKNDEVLSIDLMRYDMEKNVNSMMDFLFLNLYIYGQENSYKHFNLGMAPLSNVGINKSAYLSERIAYLIYKHGNKFYSFKGLRNYKQKYASVWVPKYTAFAKGNWILYSFIALGAIDRRNAKSK